MVEILSIQNSEAEGVTEPVALAEVKAWASIDYADDDALIESLIPGARQDIEKETNLALVEKAVVVEVTTTKTTKVKMPYGAPSSVVVTDNDNDETLTEDDEYSISGRSVKINWKGEYSIAYTVTPEVPDGLKDAIKMLVTYRYNNRGDQEKQTGLPEDIRWKIEKYKEVWL